MENQTKQAVTKVYYISMLSQKEGVYNSPRAIVSPIKKLIMPIIIIKVPPVNGHSVYFVFICDQSFLKTPFPFNYTYVCIYRYTQWKGLLFNRSV